MSSEFTRRLRLELPQGRSAFLWGPRKTGKSTLLRQTFPDSLWFDFLKADEYFRYLRNPQQLREVILAAPPQLLKKPIILDEVQKIPALLDEVHGLIEEKRLRFVLCGSSARKLKRGQANLLGGRAWRFELFPLTTTEIGRYELLRLLNRGLLPDHYQDGHYARTLRAYVQDYLKEEIQAEGLTRNLGAFARFLDIAGLMNGETIVFSSVAGDTGVDAKTVREYFQILEDTMLGQLLGPFHKKKSRNLVREMPRFYLFDPGVANFLAGRTISQERGSEFGRSFEHFIYTELRSHRAYSELFYPLHYFRTQSGQEVDFILGDGEIAVEVKSSENVRSNELRGLQYFKEHFRPARAIVVTREKRPRMSDGMELIPYHIFLEELWSGKMIS